MKTRNKYHLGTLVANADAAIQYWCTVCCNYCLHLAFCPISRVSVVGPLSQLPLINVVAKVVGTWKWTCYYMSRSSIGRAARGGQAPHTERASLASDAMLCMGRKSRKPGTAASYAVLLAARSPAATTPAHVNVLTRRLTRPVLQRPTQERMARLPGARRVGVGVSIPSRSTRCVERPARDMITFLRSCALLLSLLEHVHMLRETGRHARLGTYLRKRHKLNLLAPSHSHRRRVQTMHIPMHVSAVKGWADIQGCIGSIGLLPSSQSPPFGRLFHL
jgi:hypothetical protein